MSLRAVKGMNDILPDEIGRWHRLEGAFRSLVELYRYEEIRTPIVEATPLFVRSIGEVTDIVEKEMYSFEHHGESLTLRPEGTAGVARAYIEHNLAAREPVTRVFYRGPMFRAERPQRGRYRQFYQAGAEIFGDPGPAVDAEMIDMLMQLMSRLGIVGVTAHVNSLGGPESRARYREALVAYLTPKKGDLGEDSQRRLETNPLRVLDSKNPKDIEALRGAPSSAAALSEADTKHFDDVRRCLDRLGTPYAVSSRLVRGFDYYTRTLFEISADTGELGAQNALAGGGRYDNLVSGLGGPDVPAIGFGLGLERLLLAMGPETPPKKPLLFLAPLGEAAILEALALAKELRCFGIAAEVDGRGGSLKSLLRRANTLGAAQCIVLGEAELARGIVQVKNLVDHAQEELARADAAKILADRVLSRQATGGA
jgi:histidyl-tRNA synthetase